MDNPLITQDEALARFDGEFDRWQRALDAIGLDRMAEPGVMGDWTAADLVAHLAGWQWKSLTSMRTALAGGAYPTTPWSEKLNNPESWEEDGDVQSINQWIHDRAQASSSESLISNSLQQWADIREIIAGLSEDQVNDRNLFPRLEGRSIGEVLANDVLFGHFQEHLADDLNPWLERNGRRA